MAPVVAAYQALRGVSFIVAVTFVSEVGDVRRFDNPRQLMAFLGLVPSERSTGETVKRGGLTLAGNRRARSGRGRLELPPSRPGDGDHSRPPRGVVESCARDCLEGADPAVRPLPAHEGRRQEQTYRRCGDRARDGRLPMGHRPPGRTGQLKMKRASQSKIRIPASARPARAPPPD